MLIVVLALVVGMVLRMVGDVFDRVHNTLVVIVFAILFAYFIYPAVKLLANRRVPVPLAATLVYLVLGAVVLGSIAWLAPAIELQAADLAHNFPHVVENVQHQLADPAQSPILGRLPPDARGAVAANAGKAGTVVAGIAAGFGTHAIKILSGTTTALIDLFLVLGLTLMILSDLRLIQSFAIRLAPRAYRESTVRFLIDVDGVIGGFVRGQVLLALAVGIAGTLVLLAVGVPYAILLGLFAGVVSIVPLVGPIFAALPVILIAFFTVGPVKLIVVAVLYAVILIVQQNVLTPLVVSKSVGVTPLVVFAALLFGSEAFGILGALLSIPIAGIIRVAADRVFHADARDEVLLTRLGGSLGQARAPSEALGNEGSEGSI